MRSDHIRRKATEGGRSRAAGWQSPHEMPDSAPRQAMGVDPEIKRSNLNRLRRIEGQIRGLQKMVEEDRYCPDILVQIASVQEALRGTGRALMQNHLQHCATDVLRHGTEDDARRMYDELLELIYRHLR